MYTQNTTHKHIIMTYGCVTVLEFEDVRAYTMNTADYLIELSFLKEEDEDIIVATKDFVCVNCITEYTPEDPNYDSNFNGDDDGYSRTTKFMYSNGKMLTIIEYTFYPTQVGMK